MTSSECQECLDRLDEFRRGTLSPAERARVETHLQQCGSCSEELALRTAIADALRSSRVSGAPAALSPDVLKAIRSTRPAPSARRPASPLLPAMLAAAIAIIGIIGFVQVRTPQDLSTATISMNIERVPESARSDVQARRADDEAKEKSVLQEHVTAKGNAAAEVPALEPGGPPAMAQPAETTPQPKREAVESRRELEIAPATQPQMAYFREDAAAINSPAAARASASASSDMAINLEKNDDAALRGRLSGMAAAPASMAMDAAETPASLPVTRKANRASVQVDSPKLFAAKPQLAFSTSSTSLSLQDETSNTVTSATLTSATLKSTSPLATPTLGPEVQR